MSAGVLDPARAAASARPLRGARVRSRTPAWIVAFALVLGLIGCVLRFSHLGAKGYGNDEATTSVHVAGHTIADYMGAALDGRVRTGAELRRFQHVDPATTTADVVRGLAREDPQHPPLYYVLARGWVTVFGDSLAAKRGSSALAGVLLIPVVVWLGALLFGRLAPGLLAGGLVAVSPFHILYAQQAREYALWALLTVVSSALLLRALREPAAGRWVGYGLALALALYTDALALYVLAAHVAYVALAARRARGVLPRFAAAVAAALLAYAPWLSVLVAGAAHGTVTNNPFLAARLPLTIFGLKWVFNAGAVFFDLDYRWPPAAVLLLPLFAGLAAAFVLLVRTTPVRVWGFVVALTAVTAGALLLPDLVRHESRSTSTRYLVPAWLGLELALGWWLARLATARVSLARWGAAAAWGFALLGIASAAVAGPLDAWWGDASVAALRGMARRIAAAPRPLVVYHATWGGGRSEPERWDFIVPELVDELPPTVRFQQFRMDAPVRIAHTGGTVFLVDPSPQFRRRLRARGAVLRMLEIESADGPPSLHALHAATKTALGRAGFVEAEHSLWQIVRLP